MLPCCVLRTLSAPFIRGFRTVFIHSVNSDTHHLISGAHGWLLFRRALAVPSERLELCGRGVIGSVECRGVKHEVIAPVAPAAALG